MSRELSATVRFLLVFASGLLAGSALHSVAAGLAASGVIWLSWRYSSAMVLFLAAIAPFSRSIRSDLLSPYELAQVKTVFAFLIGGVGCLRFLADRTALIVRPPIILFLFAWIGLMATSCVHSFQVAVSLFYELSFIGAIALFILASNFDHIERRRFLLVIFGVASAIAALSIFQFLAVNFRLFPFLWKFILAPREQLFLRATFDSDSFVRVSGTFTHPNQLGVYFALIIPVVFSLIARRGQPRGERSLLIGLGVLLLLSLYATNSRANILWTFVSLFVLGLHRAHRWILIGMLIVMVGFGGTWLVKSDAISEHFQKVARLKTGISSRAPVWKNVGEMIRRNPWLGVGPGLIYSQYVNQFGFFVYDNQYEIVDLLYALQSAQAGVIYKFYAHNLYLQMMAESGVPTLVLFMLGVGIVVFLCEQNRRRPDAGSASRACSAAVASTAVGFLFFGFFDAQITFTTMALNGFAAPMLAIGLPALRGACE